MHSLDKRSVRQKSVLAVVVVVCLSSCTEAVTTGPASPNGVPPKSPATVVSPSRSASVGCGDSRPEKFVVTSGDWILGPLSYPGYTNGRVPPPDVSNAVQTDGSYFFKIGTHLLPDHTVTVTIGDAARSYAGIKTERGPAVGYSTVTYTSCAASTPSSGPGGVWWVGGFTLVGRSSACVPLEVQVTGEADIRHVHLLIGRSSCT